MTRKELDELAAIHRAARKGYVSKNDAKLKKKTAHAAYILSALPYHLQPLMRLKYCDGYTWQEIADRTGVSIDCCKRDAANAFRLLNLKSGFAEITALHHKLMDEGIAHSFTFSPTECELVCGKLCAVQSCESRLIDASSDDLESYADTMVYDLRAYEIFRRIANESDPDPADEQAN